MTEPMTAAEEAAFDIISTKENEWPWGTAEELARDIVAAVRPILDAEHKPTDERTVR